MTTKVELHADGGARGNPGPAGIGFVITDRDGEILERTHQAIGESTNNVAEYTALIKGLRAALDLGATEINVMMDSELVVSQVTGKWKIKNDRLRGLAVEARSLLERFSKADIKHVPREMNADADRLANLGMDEAQLEIGEPTRRERPSLLE